MNLRKTRMIVSEDWLKTNFDESYWLDFANATDNWLIAGSFIVSLFTNFGVHMKLGEEPMALLW